MPATIIQQWANSYKCTVLQIRLNHKCMNSLSEIVLAMTDVHKHAPGLVSEVDQSSRPFQNPGFAVCFLSCLMTAHSLWARVGIDLLARTGKLLCFITFS